MKNSPASERPGLLKIRRQILINGSAKTDPVRFKWRFGEGLLKDKFAFFEAYKNPIPKRRRLLAKRPFLSAKRALLKSPFKLDWVSFSTPEIIC